MRCDLYTAVHKTTKQRFSKVKVCCQDIISINKGVRVGLSVPESERERERDCFKMNISPFAIWSYWSTTAATQDKWPFQRDFKMTKQRRAAEAISSNKWWLLTTVLHWSICYNIRYRYLLRERMAIGSSSHIISGRSWVCQIPVNYWHGVGKKEKVQKYYLI